MNKTLALIVSILIAVFFASCSNPAMSTALAATEIEDETADADINDQKEEQESIASDNTKEIEDSSSKDSADQGDAEAGDSEGEDESGSQSDESESDSKLTEKESEPEKNEEIAEVDNGEKESVDETTSTDRPDWAKSKKWDKIDWEGFDWQNMTLQELLNYLGIKGKHLGWDK